MVGLVVDGQGLFSVCAPPRWNLPAKKVQGLGNASWDGPSSEALRPLKVKDLAETLRTGAQKHQAEVAVSTNWGGPVCGCPCNL